MKLPHHIDPRNLLTLRWDLCSGLFDKAYFVIAPQFGELRVHFFQHSEEGGQGYHDVPFNADSISLELLRAFMKIVCDMDLDSESFRFLEVDKHKPGKGKAPGPSTAKKDREDDGSGYGADDVDVERYNDDQENNYNFEEQSEGSDVDMDYDGDHGDTYGDYGARGPRRKHGGTRKFI